MSLKTLKYKNVWYRQVPSNGNCNGCIFYGEKYKCNEQARLFHSAHQTGNVETTIGFCDVMSWEIEPEWVDDDASIFEVISRLTGDK